MIEDCFIDSGAWSLFRLHTLKLGKKAKKRTSSKLDFSYFDLKKSSEFRAYCDAYAAEMKKRMAEGVRWFANVDVIGNAEMTRLTQHYFEQEHGVTPVPVVHFPSPRKYLDYYLERGYKMIGLGGFARRPDRKLIKAWVDEAFRSICPESNKRLPITKVHGFAMTTFELIRRWPWFSVDSTSYLLYGTYGLLCIPRWSETLQKFRFDIPPKIISISARGRPIDYKTRLHITNTYDRVDWSAAKADVGGEGLIRDLGHGSLYERSAHSWTMKWLEHVGAKLGTVDKDGEMVEPGVVSSNEVRTSVNLRYFMDMVDTIPKWPWALPEQIVAHHDRRQQTLENLIPL